MYWDHELIKPRSAAFFFSSAPPLHVAEINYYYYLKEGQEVSLALEPVFVKSGFKSPSVVIQKICHIVSSPRHHPEKAVVARRKYSRDTSSSRFKKLGLSRLKPPPSGGGLRQRGNKWVWWLDHMLK